MWKNVMSIQYTVPGFESTTFGTWVSSHNHLTRAPAQGQVKLDCIVGYGMWTILLLDFKQNKRP